MAAYFIMEFQARIWSKEYCPGFPEADTEQYTISVDKRLWERCMRDEHLDRMFVKIQHPHGGEPWIAPMGSPIDMGPDSDETYAIFVPVWMLDSGSLQGEGEDVQIEALTVDAFPEATKLVFRVVDSAFYSSEIKEELEKALSSLGVVRQHTTLSIPLESLDGFKVDVFISKTEPANIVLCHGEEIPVEFEEPLDQIPHVPPSPPTPPPQAEPQPEASDTSSMLPTFETPSASSSFAGQGYVLGSSNVNIPEWRRGLAPPPRK